MRGRRRGDKREEGDKGSVGRETEKKIRSERAKHKQEHRKNNKQEAKEKNKEQKRDIIKGKEQEQRAKQVEEHGERRKPVTNSKIHIFTSNHILHQCKRV